MQPTTQASTQSHRWVVDSPDQQQDDHAHQRQEHQEHQLLDDGYASSEESEDGQDVELKCPICLV